MSKKASYITYMEDAEEDSGSSIEGIEGTRKYAISEAQYNPRKERPNTGKSRGDKQSSRRPDMSSPEMSLTDSDSTPRSSKREKESRRAMQQKEAEQRDKERRRRERKQRDEEMLQQQQKRARAEARAAKEREVKALKKPRPTSLTHSKTQPIIQQYKRGHVDDPSHYGIQQPAVSGMRPRAQTRPASYYAPPKPPIAHAGWHQVHQAPAPFPLGAFPPPQQSWEAGSPSSYAPSSPGGQSGYFDNAMAMQQQQQHAHLKNRFDRPSSSMGFRTNQPSQLGYTRDDYEEEVESPITRRVSRSTSKKHHDEDRKRMPPPPARPQSALPPSAPYRPPPVESPPARRESTRPPPSHRRSVGFVDQRRYDDDDLSTRNEELYTDVSHEPSYERRNKALARARRGSVTYESPGMDIMPAGGRARRGSIYTSGGLEEGGASLDDDKYFTAMAYQDDISGGSSLPFTAENLRKASKRGGGGGGGGGSSRSTRSSGSHDDSEYKRSNTTGITQSSSGAADDVTVKLSGAALVRVHGAEIECADGGEITFSSRPVNTRTGSDRASSAYQLEDSRSRTERKALPHRPRAPSQADSHRGYAPSHAPYDPTFNPDDYI